MSNNHYKTLEKTGKWGKKGAGAILYDPFDNTFVLGLRSDIVLEPNTYGTFGGAIDFKEKKIDAIKREINEELGLNIDNFRFKQIHIYKENNFRYSNFLAVSILPIDVNKINFNNEHSEIRKMKIEDWLKVENLHYGVKNLFNQEYVLSYLKEWQEFKLSIAESIVARNNKIIGRINKEIHKPKNKNDDSIQDFLKRVKSKKFKENNKLKSKIKKIKK